jgi:hypothetical protein
MVATRSLGAMQLFVGKNEKLWKCVNPVGGKVKQIQKATWNEIHQFLRSSAGRSAILASECRLSSPFSSTLFDFPSFNSNCENAVVYCTGMKQALF